MVPTFTADDDVIDAWMEYMGVTRGRSARTVEAYRSVLGKLREFLEGKPLMDADEVDLETFCGLWLHKRGVIAQSRKPYISAVRGFYAWLKASGAVASNASSHLVHPMTGRPLPRVMTLANAERLMWAPDMGTFIGLRDAAILSLLIGCGLRISGLVGLNEGDLQTVPLEKEMRLVVRVTEKGNRDRLMPVPREAEMVLRVYMGHEELAVVDRTTRRRDGRDDKVLFVSVRSTLLGPHEHVGEKRRLTRKGVQDLILRYGTRLEIPRAELHPHAMRHLFGTELLEGDTSMLSIQELMGHVDPKSTAVYTHLAMGKKIQAMDRAAPLGKMRTPVSELLRRLPK